MDLSLSSLEVSRIMLDAICACDGSEFMGIVTPFTSAFLSYISSKRTQDMSFSTTLQAGAWSS